MNHLRDNDKDTDMVDETFNQPLCGNSIARFSGPATMMRLPTQETAEWLDACFVGIPNQPINVRKVSWLCGNGSGGNCEVIAGALRADLPDSADIPL